MSVCLLKVRPRPGNGFLYERGFVDRAENSSILDI